MLPRSQKLIGRRLHILVWEVEMPKRIGIGLAVLPTSAQCLEVDGGHACVSRLICLETAQISSDSPATEHVLLEELFRLAEISSQKLDMSLKNFFMGPPLLGAQGCDGFIVFFRMYPTSPMTKDRLPPCLLSFLCIVPLASCNIMSMVGPQKGGIVNGEHPYKLISIKSRADLPRGATTGVVGQIPAPIRGNSYSDKVRSRDSLQFTITDLSEQSPFFSKGSNVGPLEVPEDGFVSIPYVGQLQVLDLSLAQIAADLNNKLKPISNTAQANVARTARIPRTANVIGEVKKSGAMPLEQANLSSIDLLAAAGGASSDDFLYTYTLRRNKHDYTFDYEYFRQHAFPVEEGDLLTVTKDTLRHFYVMGAIMKTTTVPFPVAAPTLADAIGAASGLDEQRSDPSGVFVFRKGNPDLVYTLNLKDPACILLSQRFAIRGEDIIYVTEAPLARWNRLISQLLPTSTAAFNLSRLNKAGSLSN